MRKGSRVKCFYFKTFQGRILICQNGKGRSILNFLVKLFLIHNVYSVLSLISLCRRRRRFYSFLQRARPTLLSPMSIHFSRPFGTLGLSQSGSVSFVLKRTESRTVRDFHEKLLPACCLTSVVSTVDLVESCLATAVAQRVAPIHIVCSASLWSTTVPKQQRL